MIISKNHKDFFIKEIREALSSEPEVRQIIIFGSFVNSDNPNDIDIAVLQNSSQGYLPLSLKYRKLLRKLSKKLPIDIFPLKEGAKGSFRDEIEDGETIYERGN